MLMGCLLAPPLGKAGMDGSVVGGVEGIGSCGALTGALGLNGISSPES